MDASAWSAQLLAEFVAAVSAAETGTAAAHGAVERAAEALDADVAAIVCGGELVAAVGYPQGSAPVAELATVRPGVADAWLQVPGVGSCAAAAAALEYPPGATLVLARSGHGGLSREETGLLRGMAQVAAMTMRMLHVLDNERSAREEAGRLACEQAALRRVATLVARAAPPGEVFTAVAAEVHGLLDTDLTAVSRFDPDDMATVVGAWAAIDGPPLDVGYRRRLGERTVRTLVFRTGLPARIDDLGDEAGPWVTAADVRSAVGVPISVEGRLWGVISVASGHGRPLPAYTEARLAGFTELAATAIANAEAQAQLTASRARLVATADQTRLRIERDLHDGAQQRLVSLALQLRAAQAAVPLQFGELSAQLGAVAAGLTGALDELREYARGIHPAILAERGLGPALKTLARRFPVPVDLQMQVEGRLPEQVEVSAYYIVSEALANAAKHAHASAVTVIAKAADEVLRVVVRDDGVGGAGFTRGTGLVGLKDRVEALDGRIFLDSPRAAGTTLRVELPLTDVGHATPANPPPRLRLSCLFPGSPGSSGQAATASAAGAGAGAGAGGTMARPPGSSAPASSNSTIPLQSRLHPCSG